MTGDDDAPHRGRAEAAPDNEAAQPIASPCVRLCVIHPEARLCTGCLRSIGEITGWTRYSDAERRAIMAALPGRAPRLRQRRGGRAGLLARRGAQQV